LSFLAFSPLIAYTLLAGVAALIWLLYLIKPRMPRVEMASTLLWRRVLGEARARKDSWRWLLSLLLALAIGLSLTFALTRPELRALGASHQRIVVILDNSASMAARTRDGATRWQHAVESARRVIQRAGAGSEALVLDTAGRAPLTGFVPVGQALEQLRRVPLSSEVGGRVPPLPVGATITDVHLFTDGVGIDTVPRGTVVHSVFEAADNVAITGFEARPVPGDPKRYEAFLQIVNAAPMPKQVALEVVGAGGFRLERQLQVAGASTVNQMLDVSRFEQGMLRAQVHSEGDAFDLDDTAYSVVSPHRDRRVLLVTNGNEFLEDSLRALPGVALTVRRLSELAALPVFDAYVFDRYAPREAPAAGALLFRPPGVAWIDAKWRPVNQSEVASWDQSDALTAGVAWRDLRLESAQLTDAESPAAVVTAKTAGGAGAMGALVIAGHARARWVAVGFALQDSNFPLQAGFPVFLGTALNWLTEGARIAVEGLGRIEVPIANAQVHDGADRRVAATATARGTLFEAPRPGVYVVSNGPQRLIVVANAIDPRVTQINYSRIGPDGANFKSTDRWHASWPEPWIWLLGLAFVLLTAEWATFSRRITV
jgi:hypothetical protein